MLVGMSPAITVTSLSMAVRTTLGGPSLRPAWACLGVYRLDDCANWGDVTDVGEIPLVERAAQYLFDHVRFEAVLYCQT